MSLSSRRASLPIYLLQIDLLKVLLHSCMIMSSKCISNLARSQPSGKSLNSLYIRPPSSHHDRLQVYLQTGMITAAKCISKLAQSRLPSTSSYSLDHSLQVCFQTCMIMASKLGPSRPQVCISYNEMISIFPNVSQIYTAHCWIHLRYPSIPLCTYRET